ncbi:MAG: hypothetical protein KJZ90_14000, partial [Rhodocyclaceae bacterium]|nr:hypothetical protein [Rhodocyclaceae bacterium]
MLAYLRRLSGYSRSQITRLVSRWSAGMPLVRNYSAPRCPFVRLYTPADVALLCCSLDQAILFRGAGLDVVWPQFVALLLIGGVLFALSLGQRRVAMPPSSPLQALASAAANASLPGRGRINRFMGTRMSWRLEAPADGERAVD